MKIRFWKTPKPEPSDEAKQALAKAQDIRTRAERIYDERQALLDHNHFADRIRIIYEGGRG